LFDIPYHLWIQQWFLFIIYVVHSFYSVPQTFSITPILSVQVLYFTNLLPLVFRVIHHYFFLNYSSYLACSHPTIWSNCLSPLFPTAYLHYLFHDSELFSVTPPNHIFANLLFQICIQSGNVDLPIPSTTIELFYPRYYFILFLMLRFHFIQTIFNLIKQFSQC
jgi:hypothetical protein